MIGQFDIASQARTITPRDVQLQLNRFGNPFNSEVRGKAGHSIENGKPGRKRKMPTATGVATNKTNELQERNNRMQSQASVRTGTAEYDASRDEEEPLGSSLHMYSNPWIDLPSHLILGCLQMTSQESPARTQSWICLTAWITTPEHRSTQSHPESLDLISSIRTDLTLTTPVPPALRTCALTMEDIW